MAGEIWLSIKYNIDIEIATSGKTPTRDKRKTKVASLIPIPEIVIGIKLIRAVNVTMGKIMYIGIEISNDASKV